MIALTTTCVQHFLCFIFELNIRITSRRVPAKALLVSHEHKCAIGLQLDFMYNFVHLKNSDASHRID